MKISPLMLIAQQIEKILGQTVKTTVSEMATRLEAAAGHCRTKRDAARLIAEEIYGRDFDGEGNVLNSRILEIR